MPVDNRTRTVLIIHHCITFQKLATKIKPLALWVSRSDGVQQGCVELQLEQSKRLDWKTQYVSISRTMVQQCHFFFMGTSSRPPHSRVGSKRNQTETASPVDFLILILVTQALMGQNQGGRKEKTSPPDGRVTGAQCGVACGMGCIFVHSSSHGKCTQFISDRLRVASSYGAMTSATWYTWLQLRWP